MARLDDIVIKVQGVKELLDMQKLDIACNEYGLDVKDVRTVPSPEFDNIAFLQCEHLDTYIQLNNPVQVARMILDKFNDGKY